MKAITTVTLLLLTFLATAQPACPQPNNPVPLDDYLPLLFIGGVAIGGYFYHKKNLKTQ
jgi:hypothetical protein